MIAASSSPAPPASSGRGWCAGCCELGAYIVVLVRDCGSAERADPQRRHRPDARWSTVASRTTTRWSARSTSTRSIPCSTSAAQPMVTTALAESAPNVRGEHPRHLQRARGLPGPPVAGDPRRRRQQRQGVRRRPDTAVYGGHAGQRPSPVRRQQELYGPAGDDLRPHLRHAGHDRPMRQHLRRRRSELEPDRAGHDPQPAAGRAADHPQQRAVHARLHLRRGRRRRLSGAGRAVAIAPVSSAKRSTSARRAGSACSTSRARFSG